MRTTIVKLRTRPGPASTTPAVRREDSVVLHRCLDNLRDAMVEIDCALGSREDQLLEAERIGRIAKKLTKVLS